MTTNLPINHITVIVQSSLTWCNHIYPDFLPCNLSSKRAWKPDEPSFAGAVRGLAHIAFETNNTPCEKRGNEVSVNQLLCTLKIHITHSPQTEREPTFLRSLLKWVTLSIVCPWQVTGKGANLMVTHTAKRNWKKMMPPGTGRAYMICSLHQRAEEVQ